MNMIQVYIMWGGIITILLFVVERSKGHMSYFREYTLVLLTVGLILTVEAIKRSRSKGPQEKT